MQALLEFLEAAGLALPDHDALPSQLPELLGILEIPRSVPF
jgi:hypothetical protein